MHDQPWLRDIERRGRRVPEACRGEHQKVHSTIVATFADKTHERHPQVHWICRKCLAEGCGFSAKRDQGKYLRIMKFKVSGMEAVA